MEPNNPTEHSEESALDVPPGGSLRPERLDALSLRAVVKSLLQAFLRAAKQDEFLEIEHILAEIKYGEARRLAPPSFSLWLSG